LFIYFSVFTICSAHDPVEGTVVEGVEVDGAKLAIKEGAIPAQPIHWP
jgi:hypothetical protein